MLTVLLQYNKINKPASLEQFLQLNVFISAQELQELLEVSWLVDFVVLQQSCQQFSLCLWLSCG